MSLLHLSGPLSKYCHRQGSTIAYGRYTVRRFDPTGREALVAVANDSDTKLKTQEGDVIGQIVVVERMSRETVGRIQAMQDDSATVVDSGET